MANIADTNVLHGLTDQMGSNGRAIASGFNGISQIRPNGVATPRDLLDTTNAEKTGNTREIIPTIRRATLNDLQGIGEDFYEKFHQVPRTLTLGNVLAEIQVIVDVYNADRLSSHTVTSLDNSAGEGIDFQNPPSLPLELESQRSLALTLIISTDGPATIDGSIGFTTDLNDTATVITGQRVVVFPFRPEAPVNETLEFLTDVFTKLDGSEQRVQLRSSPRQVFELSFSREEATEGFRLAATLFDRRGSSFGVPVWVEPTTLSLPVEVGDTTVPVKSTAFADYRIDGLGIIWASEEDAEVFEISAFDGTTITTKSPLGRAFDAGTEVFPVRICLTDQRTQGTRAPVGNRTFSVRMRATDNIVDLADASAFNTLNGKVFLDGPNAIERELTEALQSRLIEFDSETGVFSQARVWEPDKRTHSKGFISHSRKELWEIRRLLHFLSGRLKSFTIPTFYRELQVKGLALSGTTDLQIGNVGFSRFIKGSSATVRSPRNKIRVLLTDGTILQRTIQDASEDSGELETIILNEVWPQDIPIEDFQRIDFIENVRADSDSIKIRHNDANGSARTTFPVRTVFNE